MVRIETPPSVCGALAFRMVGGTRILGFGRHGNLPSQDRSFGAGHGRRSARRTTAAERRRQGSRGLVVDSSAARPRPGLSSAGVIGATRRAGLKERRPRFASAFVWRSCGAIGGNTGGRRYRGEREASCQVEPPSWRTDQHGDCQPPAAMSGGVKRTSFGGWATNGRKATAAAMRYGYRRGEIFEGYEHVAGNRAVDRSHPRVEHAMPRRNGTNPMSGTGMQQARDPRPGENRRGGANPRGRNGKQRLGSLARRALATASGSGRPRARRRRGTQK